jgi:hypothetical protein
MPPTVNFDRSQILPPKVKFFATCCDNKVYPFAGAPRCFGEGEING